MSLQIRDLSPVIGGFSPPVGDFLPPIRGVSPQFRGLASNKVSYLHAEVSYLWWQVSQLHSEVPTLQSEKSHWHIHTVIHVHTLTKVWSWNRGHCDTVLHRGTHVYRLMQRARADMGSQGHMHTCTDACTHSNQDVGPEKPWLGHT